VWAVGIAIETFGASDQSACPPFSQAIGAERRRLLFVALPEGATMDPKLTLVLANGLELWLDAALADLRMSATPEDVAELAKAMDTGDVRVVYNIRANVISIETFDPNDETATELFRVHLGSRKPSTSDPNAH
jgi:hypothetical protein